jgi:hypothetical protein
MKAQKEWRPGKTRVNDAAIQLIFIWKNEIDPSVSVDMKPETVDYGKMRNAQWHQHFLG